MKNKAHKKTQKLSGTTKANMMREQTRAYTTIKADRVDVGISAILAELSRAEDLHPDWPEDLIYQLAILSEEAGEAVQAANNHVHHRGDIEAVREELVQTGAMALRCLINLRGVRR